MSDGNDVGLISVDLSDEERKELYHVEGWNTRPGLIQRGYSKIRRYLSTDSDYTKEEIR